MASASSNNYTLDRVEIQGPGAAPAGHVPIPNYLRVRIVTQGSRVKDWQVVLPLAEVLDAIKTLSITELEIQIAHPAFQQE